MPDPSGGPLTLAWTLRTLLSRAEARLQKITLEPLTGPPVRWVASMGGKTTNAYEDIEDTANELERLTR
jgi:hypothetical protein